jgi:cell volume regulation protein A
MDASFTIIIICVLLIISYIFDITAQKTKIPSVLLLLALGNFSQYLAKTSKVNIPYLDQILPVLGTIGLILIVIEGSIDLKVNKKGNLILKSAIVSFFPMIALAIFLAYLFVYFGCTSWKTALINAIPFCIISSAIAIPSVRDFLPEKREFIIFESSFSDIVGITFFNFFALHSVINLHSFVDFTMELIIIFIITIIATIVLSFLLFKIDHHVKFLPIILLVVLIFAVSKLYHLPGLIFIMSFGLFLGNIHEIAQLRFFRKIPTIKLEKEVVKFKDIVTEFTFLIRSIFFILFGYLINLNDLFHFQTLKLSALIVVSMLVFRAVQLLIIKEKLFPLLFVAPRGLITILLFLAIGSANKISFINEVLITQVIVLSSLIMMFGTVFSVKKQDRGEENEH